LESLTENEDSVVPITLYVFGLIYIPSEYFGNETAAFLE
jgi:hypothetical protein